MDKVKVYLILEDNRSILGYTKNKCLEGDNVVEMEVDENFLDPEIFNNYYLDGDDNLVKMTPEEFKIRRPFYNKIALSDVEILNLQKNVLSKRNENLTDCVMELSNALYQNNNDMTDGVQEVNTNIKKVRMATMDTQKQNIAIINLWIEKIIMGEKLFSDIPDGLKSDVEDEMINQGIGYLSI